jgi:hypothetical protein
MNKKLLALVVITLIAGTGVGYGLGYGMFQPQVSGLECNVSNLQSEISTLTANYNSLNSSYNELFSDHKNLNESNVELLLQYKDLLFHYNLINGPASNFTTIQDLQITLTLHRTTYYYKDPISGNVTITYLNGTPFEGSFYFSIFFVGGDGFSSHTPFNMVNGFKNVSYGPPAFVSGPGTYIVQITAIYTIDGFAVVAPPAPTYAGLPKVQIEAK